MIDHLLPDPIYLRLYDNLLQENITATADAAAMSENINEFLITARQ
jgi:hypothetical protein